jgi:hypothetical protein
MAVSIRRMTIKMPLAGYSLGATLLELSAGKVCKPECIDAVIYLALFLMLYPQHEDGFATLGSCREALSAYSGRRNQPETVQ